MALQEPQQNKDNRRYDPSRKLPAPIADVDGKIAPRDTELEQAVLGALMLEKDAFTTVCDLLRPESFYVPAHQKIYQAIQQLGASQHPIDMLTVTQKLRCNGDLEAVGGPGFISSLTAGVASGAHIDYHAHILSQKYIARQLISFASTIEKKAFDDTVDVEEVLQEAEGGLFTLSQNNLKREVVQVDVVLSEAIHNIELAGKNQTGLSGLETGFHDLDAITSGWQRSDLVIIAARPAMGKTAFVLSMAKNMAVNYNIPTAVFSLEMSNVQLVNRLISNVCELEGDKIKSGQLTPAEWDKLNGRVKSLYSAPLYIDDTGALSIFELRTKARRLVREHQVKIIIIDYLQLMNASGMKFGSREQEVSIISRSLKQLAKELNIPIIALSQLNRGVENRGVGNDQQSKRPQLSDLRESGAIEQDADIVCFIHRPEYYTRTGQDSEGHDIRGLALFIIAKHRNGRVADVQLRFIDRFARFQNWDEDTLNTQTVIGSKMNDDKGNDTSPTAPFTAPTPFAGGSANLGSGEDVPF